MKQTFINKWSTWWMLDKQGKKLTEAFERELDELINGNGGEITKDALRERKFKEGNNGYFILYINTNTYIYVNPNLNKAGVESDDNFEADIPLTNLTTLSQLDALIEMFKTE